MSTRSQINIQAYNETAREYDKFSDHYTFQKEYAFFKESIGNPAGSVLDVGCGAGRDTREISKFGYAVTGIDLSEKMLEIARGKTPGASFSKMDFRQLGFNDNTFDGVWANASLFLVTKDEVIESLKEIYRVLKPGGVAFVSFKEGEGLQVKHVTKELQKQQELYSYTEMRDTLKKIGFRILMTERKEDTTRKGLFWLQYFVKKP